MNYILLPSLKHAAAVRTASLLYHDCEIEIMLEKGTATDVNVQVHEQWQLKEIEIADKLSPLLPSLLRKTVAKVIRPMHNEVEAWKRNHEFLLKHLGACCCTWLLWKTDGTINRTQTAKKLVVNDNIDPKIRFIMACTYFLEDEVLALWERIKPVRKRKKLVFEDSNSAVKFWIRWLKRKNTKHWSEMVDEYFRIPSTYPCYPPMDIPLRVSCFYPFLSREMKQHFIQYLAKPSCHADDFQICVNNMNETDRIEAFKTKFPFGLFFCLRWPYRSVFIKMAKEVFSYLTFDGFGTILHFMLCSYIFDGYEDFHLFEEFWLMSPATFKDETKKLGHSFATAESYFEFEHCPQALKEIVRKCYLD
ncbi:hypothetical protein AVEN_88026-1 [Araneus ventricosus]|uniref:Uncharacterized protein n=1 Tax=Araneus ventricosus TaxID=182803 RepID=A0A4Y2TYU7_ARAVE|nr:hypothetical protein AVEN_88026-1 [Araneus ventricosus]